MIDIGEFIDLYQVKYGDFPANPKSETQIAEWKRVLAMIPERKLPEVFSLVNQILGRSIKKPRTREFENALKQMEIGDKPPDQVRDGLEGCGICYNSGVFSVWVTYMQGGRKALGFHKEGYPYEVGVPCKCSKGKYLRQRFYPKVTDEQQERAFQWLVEQTEIAKANGTTVLRFLFMQAKQALRGAKLRHRGKKMQWLKEMLGKEDVDRVVRSSGQRAKLGGPAEPDDSGAVPVRDTDDTVPFALPE